MITLNGIQITPTRFPDNTIQVWKLPEILFDVGALPYRIEWFYDSDQELLELYQLVLLLKSYHENGTIRLYIDYLPYGRQDKQITNTTTFGLQAFARLLNSMGLRHITILDPHSSATFLHIYNATAVYPEWEVAATYGITQSDIICYPDKGAEDKYKDIYKRNYIAATKVRNQETGAIEGTSMDTSIQIKGLRVLIVDDICDGGATFIDLARLLYSRGAEKVSLFCTHGLFSKGTTKLYDAGIENIFTAKGQIIYSRTPGAGFRRVFGEKI